MTTKSYRSVSDSVKLKALAEHIFDKGRKTPVVVVTNRLGGSGPCVPPVLLQNIVGDLANVFHLSPQLLPEFNHYMHGVFGIVPSGMRVYKGGMTTGDHHNHHPVWNESRIDQMVRESSFTDALLRSVTVVRRFQDGRDVTREKPALKQPAPPRISTRPILKLALI